MATYQYTAVDKFGKEKKGSIDATTPDRAASMLKGEGLIPVKVTEQSIFQKDINLGGSKVNNRELAVFCRQFVSIINAGVPIMDALGMMEEQTENKQFRKAIGEVRTSVAKGETLGNSMRQRTDVFPTMLINMVDAGEASGSIDVSFTRMATQFEKDAHLAGLVKKAMIYPIVVFVVAIAVCVVLLVKVVPTFMEMFKDMDVKMPGITTFVVNASDWLKANWFIAIGVIVLIVIGFKIFTSTQTGTVFFATLAIKLPALKNFTIKSASSRLARTLSTLTAAGISMIDSLDITAKTMTNYLFKQAVYECKEEVKKGVPLSEPLKRCGLFPPMVIHMTKIGEETGDLEAMLTKMADYYDEEVENATQALMAALEPVIILMMAGICGVIIGAVVAPMGALYTGLDNL
ncbi:MAG: type II secretion system F family protein [Lachnospiraceae bacterium]|nr:type II secretion system F family protein [Lachnospiraceae bacterium]